MLRCCSRMFRFNPRAYVRRDLQFLAGAGGQQRFNPRAYVRRDFSNLL
ncbi:hypothetical protein HMPREF9136_1694 [Prevotella dentalis DSM 3688]|uniref:Uncharacterized protein n=1 Tax=Prevotella dentalis (strain ATCC 49559 / DSM 3688 / JCM 13448 / NCTC 12043 / ES 2772) TaxID=908937 RepID=F9D4B6_PREDD|nr:hypothetical protein HMPREF9136_1694 [Prevotella dentalis DSM 3688]